MAYHVLMTLDLEKGVSPDKRKKVYEHLKSKDWTKLPDLTTAWSCSFNEEATRASALEICKDDIENAISEAGISSYSVALQLGKGHVEEFGS